jgi:tetratricopeptide (TPR) repeat protein
LSRRPGPNARLCASWWVGPAVAIGVAATFARALGHGFVNWDDAVNFTENPAYRGLGWTHLTWMFSPAPVAHYMPVTWVSHGLEYVLWGMDPVGYHLTNLLLHSANVWLVWYLARRLLSHASAFGPRELTVAAGTTALVFGVHPLRVEAVAWVSARGTLLSGTFTLLTVLLYLRATIRTGTARRWTLGAAVAAYALALGAKPIVVGLPLVLVLLDVYPLRRLPASLWRWRDRTIWLEKLPFVALAGLDAFIVGLVDAQRDVANVLPIGAAATVYVHTLWFHVQKLLLPVALSPLYEMPAHLEPLDAPFVVAGLGGISVTALLVGLARAWPGGLAAWVYHVISLAPVASALHVGPQLTADRYSYLAGLGWTLLIGAAAGCLVERVVASDAAVWRARLALGLLGVWVLGLAGITWHQLGSWHSTETLWARALAVAPDCASCHQNLGVYLMQRGDTEAGTEHLEQSAALRPDRFMAFGRLGQAYEERGWLPAAIAAYRHELALRPHSVGARIQLGGALLKIGQPAAARAELERALVEAPDRAAIYTNLGLAMDSAGRARLALWYFHRAIELAPPNRVARLGLSRAYRHLDEHGHAQEQDDIVRTLPEPAGVGR